MGGVSFKKRKATGGGNKVVAYISSPLVPEKSDRQSFDFFALLLGAIVQKFEKSGYDVVVKVAQKARDSENKSNQPELLKSVIADAHLYEAIVIAPFKTAELKSIVTQYQEDRSLRPKNLPPLVTVDKVFETVGRGPTAYGVRCDARSGGALAAKAFFEYWESDACNIKKTNRVALILKGLEGSEPRIEGFKQAWQGFGLAPGDCITSAVLPFTRQSARDYVLRKLKSARIRKDRFRAIFACNDEMAYGAYEALASLHNQTIQELLNETANQVESRNGGEPLAALAQRLSWINEIRIVGFDGISDVVHLVSTVPFVLGTVDVQLNEQAHQVVELVKKLNSMDVDTEDKYRAQRVTISDVAVDYITGEEHRYV